jgi:anti-sigma B factor antagonist
MAVRVDVRGARLVVSVMGEVDYATAPALEQTLRGVADDRTDEVIVDLTGCTFLDSQGLRALIATKGRLHPSLGAAGNGHCHG